MAEDLNATRGLRGGGAGSGGAGGGGGADGANGGPADEQRNELRTEDLRGNELASRAPRVDYRSADFAGPTPVRRWASRAHSVPEIERELNKIWGSAALRSSGDGERHVAARSSVLNLVVVAPRQEIAEHCASTIAHMAGRHPSRSVILSSRDADGPPGIDAQIEAHCVAPSAGGTETCAEMIYITTSGETSYHLAGIIVPLLVHDLPVALWWPSEPRFRSHRADRLLPMADSLIVDGASWPGNGLDRLREMARIAESRRLVVSDFALIRQSRWREAVASVYDLPDLRPHLRSIRAITVEYASPTKSDPDGLTNIVKPVYHVAWLASRLEMTVHEPLHRDGDGRRVAMLGQGGSDVEITLRPVESPMPPGTTLRVEIRSRRHGREVIGDVTAEQQTVDVVVVENGSERLRRSFLAPRQNEIDSLAQAVEESTPDPIASGTIAMAARFIGPAGDPAPRHAPGSRNTEDEAHAP